MGIDLRYDTEAINTAITDYREIVTEMDELKTELSKLFEQLKDEDWKSKAGEAFSNKYEEGWAANVDKYIAVVNELADILEYVNTNYYGPLVERAEALNLQETSDV